MSEEPMDLTEMHTPVAEEMQRLHELFTVMITAGFTESQALKLLSEMLAAQRNSD